MFKWTAVSLAVVLLACSSTADSSADFSAASETIATLDTAPGDVRIDRFANLDTTGPTGDVDAGQSPDGGVTDLDSGPDFALLDVQEEDLGPGGPVADSSEPQPVVVEKWLVTYAKDSDNDPVGDQLDAGTFVMPAGPGKDANGVEWLERVPGEGGKMGFAGYGLFYAVATIELAQDAGIIVRADGFMTTHINGAPQPTDPYKKRSHRTPGVGRAGPNSIVAVAYSAVNDPEIELWTTPDELYFNPNDATVPHVRVGDMATQYVGIAVLNLTDQPLRQTRAKVVASEWFEETQIVLPALAPAAVTQVPFKLALAKAVTEAGQDLPLSLRIEVPELAWSYEYEMTVPTVSPEAGFKRTRLSNVDHSVQYYGVKPPSAEAPANGYGLALSLHGAGVQGMGQANSYAAKDWAYVVAPTNRRPFGFDWEEWGRLDGMEALDHAMASFDIDPTRVFVTGHSMGGHGTWQFGVHQADRFRVVGPSAGWNSFYTYGNSPKPTGPFARARASSDTIQYVGNLANRSVYVIHGDADDNVPISEAYLMQDAVEPIADEFYFHIQPGAGHWWNGDQGPGTDCVDWPPMFDLMKDRALDLTELDFEFISPSPWINDTYSYVQILSQLDPYEDSIITSAASGDKATLLTSNVRSMSIDGAALLAKGITTLTVDDEAVELTDSQIPWGPQSGKTPEVQGPFNQVFHKPFCFAYPANGNPKYKHYAAYLISTWNIIGNGHGCALPREQLTPAIRAQYNIIYLGVPRHQVPVPESMPFGWDEQGIDIDGFTVQEGTLLSVFPESGHLSAFITTTVGEEYMLFWYSPFSSRAGMPDWVGWTNGGVYGTGFFDGDWQFDDALAYGLE